MFKSPVDYSTRFTVDPHLISVLGEQLITSEKVGILELIKNSYDAMAEKCTVIIEKVLELESLKILDYDEETRNLTGPVITIIDDGIGMNKETLESGWLRAASIIKTKEKERIKIEREKALKEGKLQSFEAIIKQLYKGKRRLPLGEKGIGRLATHRLGRHLWLRTKTSDEPWEWELKIDWDKFDEIDVDIDNNKRIDLSGINLILRHQPPTYNYGPKRQGTIIRCYGGRKGFRWTKNEVIMVGRAIADIKSPHNNSGDFNVEFKNTYNLGEEFKRPIERVQAPFIIHAKIKGNGNADVNIDFKVPHTLQSILKNRNWRLNDVDLRDFDRKYWGLRRPCCGPFEMNFKIWFRDIKWLREERKEVSAYLDAYGGIGIYRDGLAVMAPDMVAHIDALDLTNRARKRASNIAYYNIIGQIEINQIVNPEIRDQSSRESQLHNQEFNDLMKLSRAVVLVTEEYYRMVRGNVNKQNFIPVSIPVIRRDSEIAIKVIDTITDTISNEELCTISINSLLGINDTDVAKEMLQNASNTIKTIGNNLKMIEEQNKGLIEAAGYGLAIAVAIHELSKSLSSINTTIERLHSNRYSLKEDDLENLLHQSKIVQSELKRIDPLRVTRLEQTRVFNIRQAISAAVGIYTVRAKKLGISIDLPVSDSCFSVRARFTVCSQVFANLFDNSLYWLSQPSWEGRDKKIRITCNCEKGKIIFEDTGPGIKETVIPHLFQPFVTGKPDGQGLGLYICDFYLHQMKASIQLIKSDHVFPGTRFLLDFSNVMEVLI